MDVLSVAFVAVLMTAAAVFVKRIEPAMGFLMTLLCSLCLLFFAVNTVAEISETVRSSIPEPVSGYLPYILKTLGIAIASETAARVSRDAGESAVASGIELIGKLGILSVCMPLIKHILDTAISYIG